MIRATAGTWVNYSTTFLFQIAFAARFGTGHRAAAFVIAFGLGVAASSVLVSAVRAAILPRVLSADGRLLSESLRFLYLLAALALGLAALVLTIAGPLGQILGGAANLDPRLIADMLRITAAFLLLEFISGELSALALARGRRLVPSLAPAFPSILACIPLAVSSTPDVRAVYLFLVAGSVLQVAFVAVSVGRPSIARGGQTSMAGATVFMLTVFTLLTLVPPIERLVAASHSPADAARYDYAMRSLRAVQQLVIGGLLLAALGDWSARVSAGSAERIRASFAATFGSACVLLLGVAAVGAVSVHGMVALIFQHGNFTQADGVAVSWIILLSLPGFCAEGVGLVITSALVGLRRNRTLALVGLANFASRLPLIWLLGKSYGGPGLAAAYSVTSVLLIVVLCIVAAAAGLWDRGQMVVARKVGAVVCGTLVAAFALMFVGSRLPSVVSGALVAATCIALASRQGLTGVLKLLPK